MSEEGGIMRALLLLLPSLFLLFVQSMGAQLDWLLVLHLIHMLLLHGRVSNYARLLVDLHLWRYFGRREGALLRETPGALLRETRGPFP